MTLVDSNVLIDVLSRDCEWGRWSVARLDEARDGGLCINVIVYAEIAPTLDSAADLDSFLSDGGLHMAELPRTALWSAAAVHGRYRSAGGPRERVLPDFIIGAHAQALACPLLTRDPRRYRTYFPEVRLITP